MGADLHMYIEYAEKKKYNGKKYWQTFGGEIYPGRNYELYGYLTNGQVRYDVDFRNGISPKDLPDNLSYEVEYDSRLWITDEGKGDHEITLEKAIQYPPIYNDENGVPKSINHPDWHSHSWLTLKEYKRILKKAKEDTVIGIEYKVILNVMKSFRKEGFDVRLIFWFDN